MPIQKVKVKKRTGFKFGEHGKIYPTKKQAMKQARAMYASGYRGSK